MTFTYSTGQKPLEGYTIKRGIGHGGFGEVYFAVSDAGKEVALKYIRSSNSEIELRGVGQCLNLKNPHLVHLYDLRTDAQGNPWLVMEYVSGESLSSILTRHPKGVAPELACTWFEGLASAIHCLHDHGIVHRDLKPGNIFLEHGVIKVGDYGLCKFMGSSQRLGQTQSIGTVHYMAPEISTGNYNRQIDIYAAGIILYEMLTGRVPFDGETAGEILMKHLTSPPDLSAVPSAFVPLLDKALCKNPANRFQHITEMSKQVAALMGRRVQVNAALPPPESVPPTRRPKMPERIVAPVTPLRRRMAQVGGSLLKAVVLTGLFSFVGGLFFLKGNWQVLVPSFFLSVTATWLIVIVSRFWEKPLEDSGRRRLALCGIGIATGLLGVWLEGYELPKPGPDFPQADMLKPLPRDADTDRDNFSPYARFTSPLPVLTAFMSYFGLVFLSMRWWKMAQPQRSRRFAYWPIIAAGFWGYVLLFLLPNFAMRRECFTAVLTTAATLQLVSPWQQPPPPRGKRLRLQYA